jgi:predicted esterase
VILLLHGSGRDGRILVEHWQDLAKKEGIILAGPDSTNRSGWNLQSDGPELLHDLVEHLKKQYSIDPRRVYVFGHSAGAIHGLALGVLESEYFAAIAAHAGVMQRELGEYARDAPRKIPTTLWVGTKDPLFPVDQVRNTRDALKAFGYPVELTEIAGHTHDYYRRSPAINKGVWAFLQRYQLSADPKYQIYK